MPETKEITYMWLKVGMSLHKALITGKRVVLILYKAQIRDYSAFVSPSSYRETIKRHIRSFWLCMGAPLNRNYYQHPAEIVSSK